MVYLNSEHVHYRFYMNFIRSKRETMNQVQRAERFQRVVIGSLVAVTTGWFLSALPWLICWLIGFPMALFYMFPYVFLTWLLVCLPLYNYVPLRSVLWEKGICVTCGAIAGPIMLWFIPMVVTSWIPAAQSIFAASLYVPTPGLNATATSLLNGMQSYAIATSVLMGAISCYYASKNRREYRYEWEECLE
jgi:hypothetical protein